MYIDAYVYTFMYEYVHGVCVGGLVRERARDWRETRVRILVRQFVGHQLPISVAEVLEADRSGRWDENKKCGFMMLQV